jgi:hypothetical protein
VRRREERRDFIYFVVVFVIHPGWLVYVCLLVLGNELFKGIKCFLVLLKCKNFVLAIHYHIGGTSEHFYLLGFVTIILFKYHIYKYNIKLTNSNFFNERKKTKPGCLLSLLFIFLLFVLLYFCIFIFIFIFI